MESVRLAFTVNTLVWQDDQMIGRLEGFESVDDGIEFATELGTTD